MYQRHGKKISQNNWLQLKRHVKHPFFLEELMSLTNTFALMGEELFGIACSDRFQAEENKAE